MSSVVKLQKDIMRNESRKAILNPNVRLKKVYHVVPEEDDPYVYTKRPIGSYSQFPPIYPIYKQLPPKNMHRCNCPECKPFNYYYQPSHCNCAQCRVNRDYYSNQYRPQPMPIPTPRYEIVESKPLSQMNTAYRKRIDSPTPMVSLPPISRSSQSVIPTPDFENANAYNDSLNRYPDNNRSFLTESRLSKRWYEKN